MDWRPLTTQEAGWNDPVGMEPWRVLEEDNTQGAVAGGVFSIPAFFILLRETIEVTIVLAVILQYLQQIDKYHLSRDVYLGTGAGIIVALIIGAVFITLFYIAKQAALDGIGGDLLEDILRLFACVVVTLLAMGMGKIMNMSDKFRSKMAKITAKMDGEADNNRWGLFLFAFITVVREGLEAIVFLAGVGSGFDADSMVLPSITGIICGIILGVVFFRSTKTLNLKLLAGFSTALLLLVAAGLCSNAFDNISDNGAFPNDPVFVIGFCCGTSNYFFYLMNAFFGYDPAPVPAQLGSYVGYWVLTLTFMWYKGYLDGCVCCRRHQDEKDEKLEECECDEGKSNRSKDVAATGCSKEDDEECGLEIVVVDENRRNRTSVEGKDQTNT